MTIKATVIRVTTTGEAGAAVGNTDSPVAIRGRLLGVHLNYHATAPATTDVTIATKGRTAAAYNLLVVSNNATNGYYAPRALPVSTANAAITNAHTELVMDDIINVSVAQADALTNCVTVTLWYEA